MGFSEVVVLFVLVFFGIVSLAAHLAGQRRRRAHRTVGTVGEPSETSGERPGESGGEPAEPAMTGLEKRLTRLREAMEKGMSRAAPLVIPLAETEPEAESGNAGGRAGTDIPPSAPLSRAESGAAAGPETVRGFSGETLDVSPGASRTGWERIRSLPPLKRAIVLAELLGKPKALEGEPPR